GGPAVLGVVVGALDVIEVGAEVDGAAVLRAGLGAGQGGEVGQFRQGDVDLERGAVVADAVDGLGEGGRQQAGVQQAVEGDVGVGVAGHHAGAQLLAVGQGDAGDGAVVDQDPAHLCVGADLGAVGTGDLGQGLGEGAHAAADVAPDAALAVGLAH